MIKRTAILMTMAFMFVSLQGAAVAGDRDRDQLKDKIQDGSCLPYETDVKEKFNLAVGQTRDQKKDGSCLDDPDYSTGSGMRMMLSGQYRRGQKQNNGDQDRLRDGSCLDHSTVDVRMVLS